jgi:hypothetical protein
MARLAVWSRDDGGVALHGRVSSVSPNAKIGPSNIKDFHVTLRTSSGNITDDVYAIHLRK